jgi:Phage gp6-like head-tail connector protein
MLTTLDTLKARLKIDLADTTDDAQLTRFLKHVSTRFERECNRKFDRLEDATDEFPANASDLVVARYPLESVSTFELKTSETAGWTALENVDYLLRPGGVIRLRGILGSESQLLRVTYTGGYVLPADTATPEQTPLPDDLEQACVEQAAFWYQRRDQLGIVNFSGEGGTLKLNEKADLLPQVQSVLRKYTRIVL